MSFTKQDIIVLRQVVREEVQTVTEPQFRAIPELVRQEVRFALREEVLPRFREMERKFDNLQTTVDGYAKSMHTFETEHIVLRSQVRRIKTVLVQKKVATDDELAI